MYIFIIHIKFVYKLEAYDFSHELPLVKVLDRVLGVPVVLHVQEGEPVLDRNVPKTKKVKIKDMKIVNG